MSYRVTAPVRGFSGEVVGVIFRDGSATVDGDVSYFFRHGYSVEQEQTKPKPKTSKTR